MYLKFAGYLKSVPTESRLFVINVIFFFALTAFNPSNKIILLMFFLLLGCFYLVTKSFSESLLFTYIVSSVVMTGKRYPLQLIPEGVFPIEIFPRGYFVNIIITSSHIISLLMAVYTLRGWFLKKQNFLNISLSDVLLLAYFILKLLSGAIASRAPLLSLVFEALSLTGVILLLFIRTFGVVKIKNLILIIASLLFFESALAVMQYINKSPLYKNIEFQVNIEYFGNAVDEPLFTFRPVGTFDHANSLGIWLAATTVFLMVFFHKYKSWLLDTSLFLGITALFLTISRSAWLGFVAGVGIIFFYTNRFRPQFIKNLKSVLIKARVFLIPIFLFLILFVVYPRVQTSLYSFGIDTGGFYFRRIQILDALQIILLNPLLGVGTSMAVFEGLYLDGYTVAASIPLAVHNWYINTALNNGLFALFIFLGFILTSLKIILNTPLARVGVFALGTVACTLSLGISGLFQPYMSTEMLILLLTVASSVKINPKIVKK